MQKANQEQVIQNANINLVAIRTAEISYFSTFFGNFGTQFALIAGFIVSSVSQVPALGAACGKFNSYLYWLTSAITFASAMHGLLCTVFVSVYGQGLALRGPVGSMVRAVDGMLLDQAHVLYTFTFTICLFTINVVTMYWVMMEIPMAAICTVITAFGVYYWYTILLRIYNRFKFKGMDKAVWNEDDEEDDVDKVSPLVSKDPKSLTPAQLSGPDKPRHQTKPEEPANLFSIIGISPEHNTSTQGKGGNKTRPGAPSVVVENGAGGGGNNSDTVLSPLQQAMQNANNNGGGNVNTGSSSGNTVVSSSNTEHSSNNPRIGYISVKLGNGSMFSDPWKRVYLVVNGSLIYYYKDKLAYDTDPQDTIRRRPIDVKGMLLDCDVSNPPYKLLLHIARDSGSGSGSGATVSTGTASHTSSNSNTKDVKSTIEFRCDTASEAIGWMNRLKIAIA